MTFNQLMDVTMMSNSRNLKIKTIKLKSTIENMMFKDKALHKSFIITKLF